MNKLRTIIKAIDSFLDTAIIMLLILVSIGCGGWSVYIMCL